MAEHTSLAAALAAMQAELPRLSKTETAKVKGEGRNGAPVNYSYGYADLAQVVETVLPALGKHGLSITSRTLFQEGAFMLEVSLLHDGPDKERETGYWPLPTGPRVGPQEVGSAMTYGRRYLTLALTGTFPGGEDDDGAKAQSSARESWDDARPRQERPAQDRPVSAPPAAPKTSWTDDEVLTMLKRLPTGEIGAVIKGYDWMAGKGLHSRTVEMDYEGDPVRVCATDLVAGRIADEALIETATVDNIAALRELADARGLLKVQVSETETLDEALVNARELAEHAAATQGSQDIGAGEGPA